MFDFGGFGEMQEQAQSLANARRAFIQDSRCACLFGKRLVVDLMSPSGVGLNSENDVEFEGEHKFEPGMEAAMAGTVIFHIDTTGSMGQMDRMKLTVGVLQRVIPDILRRGLTVILNGWSSLHGGKVRSQVRTCACCHSNCC